VHQVRSKEIFIHYQGYYKTYPFPPILGEQISFKGRTQNVEIDEEKQSEWAPENIPDNRSAKGNDGPK